MSQRQPKLTLEKKKSELLIDHLTRSQMALEISQDQLKNDFVQKMKEDKDLMKSMDQMFS